MDLEDIDLPTAIQMLEKHFGQLQISSYWQSQQLARAIQVVLEAVKDKDRPSDQ